MEEQIALYQRAVEIDPTAASPGYRLIRALRQADHHEEAALACQKILQSCKPDVDGFRTIYSFHPSELDAPYSPEDVRQILQEPLTQAQQHKWHGYVLLQMTEPPAALSALEESLQLEPNDPDTSYFLGLTHQLMHQSALARTAFERTLELQPTHPCAAEQLRKISADGSS